MLKQARIIGTGSYVPEKILSNSDLEKMVDTSDEWIVSRTGMKERRIARSNEFSSDMGAQAARYALERANLSAEEVDLIIVATSTPDYMTVSTACLIQEAIGAKKAASMDIQAACSGYLYGIATAKAFVESGIYTNVIVIAAEKLSTIVDYQNRSTCILFGDGAAACLITSEQKEGLMIPTLYLASAGEHAALGYVPAGGCREPASQETIDQKKHFIQMNGNEIFKYAVRNMEAACDKCLASAQLKKSDIAWLIPHQANQRIIDALAKRFEIPLERVYVNIHKYGNTSASSLGIALDEMLRSYPVAPDEHIMLTVFGFGLTWGACLLKAVK